MRERLPEMRTIFSERRTIALQHERFTIDNSSEKGKRVAFTVRIGYPLIHRKTHKPLKIKGLGQKIILRQFYQNHRRIMAKVDLIDRNCTLWGAPRLEVGCISLFGVRFLL